MKSPLASVVACVLLVGCALSAPPPSQNRAPSDPPQATATRTPEPSPAQPDPEAELDAAIQIREEWGLRSDPEWVREIADDPSSVISALGIPVTPEEAAQLETMFEADPRSRLTAYGTAQRDEFGGAYVDNDAGGVFVMLFTANLERHRQAIGPLTPPGLRVEIRPCRYTEAELKQVMNEFIAGRPLGDAIELVSLGLDTINNVVVLEAKSDLPGAKEQLETLYGGRLVANIHPLPGPWQNAATGDGWRLLAAGSARSEVYMVRAATDEESWHELWTQLDPVNPRPEVDFASEIAVSFGHGIGSSCPELRLDDVVIDSDRGLVYSLTSDPLMPRACTADLAGGAYFVVALVRDALPPSPFTVRLAEDIPGCRDCGFTPEIEVDLGE